MAAAEQEQELVEEAMSVPLPEAIAEQIQDGNSANVERQIAEAQFNAAQSDSIKEYALAQHEENIASADVDGFVFPNVHPSEQEEMPPKAKA